MIPPFDIAADLDTPVSAYLKLGSLEPRFLLESVERGQRIGRYSFIGFGQGANHVLSHENFAQNRPGDVLECLRRALAHAPKLAPVIPDLPFSGGLVGVASFDMVNQFERLPVSKRVDPELPLAAYYAPPSLLVFDHVTRRAALLHHGTDEERQGLREQVVACLKGPAGTPGSSPGNHQAPEASMTKEEFVAAVEKTKKYIRSGDVYQLVLSIRFSGKHSLSPFQIYRALRLLNPSPYMYFLQFGQLSVVGSSPEALVSLKDNVVSLRPIAGTRPRCEDPHADLEQEKHLLADPKERAEHVMLVDLARNDLGRVATAGSVTVDPYFSVERYSHVMHLVSGVAGELEQTKDAYDAFAAAFPAGTLVGAPKVRAMELIHEMEPHGRGFYAGTAGYFGHGGNMDQAIAIRTLVFNGDQYSFQAGAGIVADSDPEKEYEEVLAKSQILRQALDMAEAGL
ncbi:MAG: anthranilate synthase component I family protein [Pseudomonadota bacterium]